MLLGEAPGYHEDLTGRPFYPEAPAGRVLRSLLRELEMEDLVYISNVVRCRPPDNKLSAFPDAVLACRKWLELEIGEVKPKVIVTLGHIPSSRFFGGLPAHEVSTLARTLADGLVIVGSFHPAYAARGVDEGARPAIKNSLIRALELARGRGAGG
jgi:DNA polymerase